MQVTLDKIKSLFKSLEDIKAETKTVTDNSVTGINILLNIMSITLQVSKESN